MIYIMPIVELDLYSGLAWLEAEQSSSLELSSTLTRQAQIELKLSHGRAWLGSLVYSFALIRQGSLKMLDIGSSWELYSEIIFKVMAY